MTVIINTDGASRGNPGLAGAGVVYANRRGRVLGRAHRFLGKATNNVAEYQALIMALEGAAERGYRRIVVRADSELLVKQLNGVYRVRNARLKPLYCQVRRLLARFDHWQAQHVPRAQNKEADRLANKAINLHLKGNAYASLSTGGLPRGT